MRELLKHIYIAAMMLVAVACNYETPYNPLTPTPEDAKSYTIMVYGCGGGNLDVYNEEVIDAVTQLDIPGNINIVGEIKWSNGYKSKWSSGDGGVTRLKYNHTTNIYDNEPFSDNSYKIADNSNLIEFLEWARSEAPADEYVIIFIGHGNAYHPAFDSSVTRAILRDDEEVAYLGLRGITDALKATGMHLNLTYMISCLTNTLEYATELAPYSDYYLAPNHVTAISGNEIYLLIEGLIGMDKHDETSIAKAAAYAIDQDYDLWWGQNILTIDHTLTDCSDIAKLNDAIREFTDIVVALYDEELKVGRQAMMSSHGFTTATIDEALSQAYYPLHAHFSQDDIMEMDWYRLSYAFDIVDIANKVASATKHGDIVRAAEDIETAATEAILHQRNANLKGVTRGYYAVTLINKEQWTTLGMKDARYERTAFDKATGWSRLLKVNNATFMHCR
jgi:hypothetical protein